MIRGYTKQELKNLFQIDNVPSDIVYQLNSDNHSMDNSALMCNTIKEVLEWCEDKNLNLIGFCKAPYYNYDFNIAFVCEDKNDFSITWFHYADWLLEGMEL